MKFINYNVVNNLTITHSSVVMFSRFTEIIKENIYFLFLFTISHANFKLNMIILLHHKYLTSDKKKKNHTYTFMYISLYFHFLLTNKNVHYTGIGTL